MDRIWQWAWDRYGARYTWATYGIALAVMLAVYLPLSFLVVAFEKSGLYIVATAVTVAAVLVLDCVAVFPNHQWLRLVQQWAAGHEIDRVVDRPDSQTGDRMQ